MTSLGDLDPTTVDMRCLVLDRLLADPGRPGRRGSGRPRTYPALSAHPGQRLARPSRPSATPGRHRRTADQHDRAVPSSRAAVSLAAVMVPAAVLGDDDVDARARACSASSSSTVNGPAGEHHGGAGRQRRGRRVDRADEAARRSAPANAARPCRPVVRKTAPNPATAVGRLVERVDPAPVVAGLRRPARALQPQQRDAGDARRPRPRDAVIVAAKVRGVDERAAPGAPAARRPARRPRRSRRCAPPRAAAAGRRPGRPAS